MRAIATTLVLLVLVGAAPADPLSPGARAAIQRRGTPTFKAVKRNLRSLVKDRELGRALRKTGGWISLGLQTREVRGDRPARVVERLILDGDGLKFQRGVVDLSSRSTTTRFPTVRARLGWLGLGSERLTEKAWGGLHPSAVTESVESWADNGKNPPAFDQVLADAETEFRRQRAASSRGRFWVGSWKAVSKIADQLGVSEAKLRAANPKLPGGYAHHVEVQVPGLDWHVADGRSTLDAIARRYGVSAAAVRRANPGVPHEGLVPRNTELVIPPPRPHHPGPDSR